MSTKSHFIYEDGIEGFEETIEPKSIFGKVVGYTAYFILKNSVLKSFEMIDDYIIIETKHTDKLPKKFTIWGDAISGFNWDEDGLLIKLEGGHHITKQIISNDYSQITVY
jgi:hypothetical protein